MSRLIRSLSAIVLGLCLVAGSARASQVVFGNLGSDGGGALAGTKTEIDAFTKLAQGFTTGANSSLLYLNTVTLGLARTGGGSIGTTISLWSGAGSPSTPASLLYTSSSQTVTGAAGSKYTFDFGGIALTTSTTYWIVLQQSGVEWFYASLAGGNPAEQNASGYSNPGYAASEDGGSNWFNLGSNRYSFSVTASATGPEPIPEPGTWAAAALLIGAAAYARWRRRPQAA